MIEEELRRETEKWIGRLDKEIAGTEGEFMENILAYRKDAEFFLNKGDLVRAFEAVIWAWAWYEIGIQTGKVKRDGSKS